MKLWSRSSRVALLSIASNTALIILKVIAGVLSGSVSIISEAIHSSMDLVASLIAFFSVSTSAKPADTYHPYGHGKIENISGIAEGVLIFVAAGLIIKEAIEKVLVPTAIEQTTVAIVVMFVSCVVNLLVSRRLYTVAKEEDSMALEADALHLKTDVYTAFGVGIGLLLMKITGLDILDPIAAMLIALLIIKEAWELCRRGFDFLLDAKLPDAEEARIIAIIESHNGEFRDFHKLKTTKSGNRRYIDFHMTVEPELTVAEAHAIIGCLKKDMADEFRNTRVSVHLDPYCGGGSGDENGATPA